MFVSKQTKNPNIVVINNKNDVAALKIEFSNINWAKCEKEFYDIIIKQENFCKNLLLRGYEKYDEDSCKHINSDSLGILAYLWQTYSFFSWAPFVGNISQYSDSPSNSKLYEDYLTKSAKIVEKYENMKKNIIELENDKAFLQQMEDIESNINTICIGFIRQLYDEKGEMQFNNINDLLDVNTYEEIWGKQYELSAMWGFYNIKKQIDNNFSKDSANKLDEKKICEKVFNVARKILSDKRKFLNEVEIEIKNNTKLKALTRNALLGRLRENKYLLASCFRF